MLANNILHLTSKNEIIEVNEANQFQWANGKPLSQFECGYFACAMARSMSKPGQPPTQNTAQIIAEAEQWYAQYNGNDNFSNTAGMTSEQEYELLRQIGLHYQAISPDIKQVKAWVQMGYPILLSVVESTVYDLSLSKNPYPWTPAGNHMILATGVLSSGNLLVRDSANCINLNDPKSLRPGPRIYSSSLQIYSATVVVPPWRPRPANNTAPTGILEIPRGWSDDGTTLVAPNGIRVVLGFRSYVLQHQWDPANNPLAPESGANPVQFADAKSGSGTRQVFVLTELGYTPSRGVYEVPLGQEFWALLNQKAAPPAPPTTGASVPAWIGPIDLFSLKDLRASARFIGDTSTFMLEQLNKWQPRPPQA